MPCVFHASACSAAAARTGLTPRLLLRPCCPAPICPPTHSDLSGSNMRLADVLPRLLQPASGAGAAATDPKRAAHWAYHLVRHLGFNGLVGG